jgi:signal transduction histidine kinase
MKTIKLPERSFKVKFKVFRFGFTDFDVFVRRFTEAAYWKITSSSETSHTYMFENGWNITLHPHGDISLYSPVLEGEQATTVYGVIDVLIAMDVRVGENCEVEARYESAVRGNGLPFLSEMPIAVLSAAALILFLATKTAELLYARILRLPVLIFFEGASFIFAVAFTYFLFKSLNQSKETLDEALVQASNQEAHENFMRNEDIRRKLQDRASIHAMDLLKEISYPLENIMAYTRFYSSHTQRDTQHWKDLTEIMDQAIRIQTVMNRAELRLTQDADLTSRAEANEKLFRQSQRHVDLVPLVVHGTDLLGEDFKTPSYTLNISDNGACLLLPDSLVAVGQTLLLENQESSRRATVRWVVEGRTENMMFAGIEFMAAEAQPLHSEAAHEIGRS